MTITPGGNPVCENCGLWYNVGGAHETEEDCIQHWTRIFQYSGPDEYPTDYFRYLAEQHIAERKKINE